MQKSYKSLALLTIEEANAKMVSYFDSDFAGVTMLVLINSMRELRFSALMKVYEEGNRENGADLYADEPIERQLALAEEDFFCYLRQVFFPTSGARYAVWEAEGQYISALRLEPYQDGLLIEGLETTPAYRRRGYAVKLINAVQSRFSATKLYSHVGKRNTASLKTHERCGFRRIKKYAVYVDGSVNDRCCTLVYEPDFNE